MRPPLLIFLFVWAVSLKAQSQFMPNPGFESWHNTTYGEDPDGWMICYLDLGSTVYKDSTYKTEGNYAMLVDRCGQGIQFPVNGEVYGFFFDWYFYASQPDTFEVSLYGYSQGILTDSDLLKIYTNGFGVGLINFSSQTSAIDTITIDISDGTVSDAFLVVDNFRETLTAIPETDKPNLKIFPNPAGNQITIEQLSVSGNQLSVEVYDALGRLVLISSINNQTSTIPLNLSKGVYLLRIKEKEEVVFWEKLIIE